MNIPKTLLAAAIVAGTGFANAEFSVTQEYNFINLMDNEAELSRPLSISASGEALLSPVFLDDPSMATNITIQLPVLNGFNETLDYLETVINGDDYDMSSLPVDTSAEDARMLFEHYPEPPTSQIPLDIMTDMGIEDSTDPEQYLSYVTVVIHEVLMAGYDITATHLAEELVGSSESYYYFTGTLPLAQDSDIYRCVQDEYDTSLSVVAQLGSACTMMAQGLTYSGVENSVAAVNYYDFAAFEYNSLQEPTRVYKNGAFITSIEHAIDFSELQSSDQLDGMFYRAIVPTGKRPLVAAVHGGLQDTMGAFPEIIGDLLNDPEYLAALTQFNAEVYYIHDDGFAEKIIYPEMNAIIREFNDKYLVSQRFYEDAQGMTAVAIDICEYQLNLRYDPALAVPGESQGYLGGTLTCGEPAVTLPGYHQVIIGYDTEVFAGSIASHGEALASDNDYGMPVYVQHIETGERLDLADAYRELRIRQGLEDMYNDQRQSEILTKTLEENGYPEENLDKDGNVEPGLYIGLMDNYPLPPDTPEDFGLWADISAADFQSLIKHLKNYLVLTDALGGDSEDLGSLDFFYRSRLGFKFTAPDVLLSGQGMFTVSNPEPFGISGTVAVEYEDSVEGISIRALSGAGQQYATEAQLDGTYAMQGLEAGTYTVTVAKDYFVHECQSATLTEDNRGAVVNMTLLAGDLNNDGRIGARDYGMFRMQSRYPNVDFDLNNDGVVDTADKQVVRSNLGAVQCQW